MAIRVRIFFSKELNDSPLMHMSPLFSPLSIRVASTLLVTSNAPLDISIHSDTFSRLLWILLGNGCEIIVCFVFK